VSTPAGRTTLFTNAHLVTMDDAGTEHPAGWLLVGQGRIQAVGGRDLPVADETVDLGGAVVTPGLVNVHHHIYQNLTRTRAQEGNLLEWLKALLPVWAGLDAEAEYAAARAGLAELALSGCTTAFDHHYVFPRGRSGLVEAEVQAARELGVRIVAARGSMDLGRSRGALPPDSIVESVDRILADTERVARLHEPSPGAWVQVAVAPCTPFTASRELMLESARLARRLGLRLHTHLAETIEDEALCVERFGYRPIDYLADVEWLAPDVWCAHSIHLGLADVQRLARTRTGVAHCPTSNLRLGAGVAPIRAMLDAGVPVGLGVDGPTAMTARQALWLATRGGAEVLGRSDIGALEPDKCADFAVWRTDGLAFGGSDDLVAAVVLSGPYRVDRLYVGGTPVVADGALTRADEQEIIRQHRQQARRFGAA
jgi:8-oxoguanine deaminase